MDLHRHAGLVDQLAPEYTLGVLRGGSRRRFESISQHDPAIRLAVETWRLRLAAMSELGPAVAPPPEVWPAIERRLNLVSARPVPPAAPVPRPKPGWFENLSFWRGWSIAATAIAAIALIVSIRELSTRAPVP